MASVCIFPRISACGRRVEWGILMVVINFFVCISNHGNSELNKLYYIWVLNQRIVHLIY